MKRYIMIGAPVTTVRTPPLLTAYLAGRGVAASVETRHVEPDQLDAFMRNVGPDAAVDGLLVTMPHKKTVAAYLGAVTATAAAAASVNAIKRLPSGILVGAQFDGAGLVNAVLAKGAGLGDSRVLLAGVGGAGLAIAQALAGRGCRRLAITDTNPAALAAAVRDPGVAGRCPVVALSDPGEGAYELLVNATPLGMVDGDPSPFAAGLIARASIVADIVADPPQTRLAAMARQAGVALITGRDMVNSQVALIADWLLGPDTTQ